MMHRCLFRLFGVVLIQGETLQLEDLKEPEPIPYSYNTLGWKIVFGLVILLLVFTLYKWYLSYKEKQYLRDAIQDIETLSLQSDLNLAQYINEIMMLLKSTAMQTFGRPEVASLHGKDWLQFLDDKVKQSDFAANEKVILQAVYKDTVKDVSGFNKEEFKKKSIYWITHHA